jgi:hypothetical protein
MKTIGSVFFFLFCLFNAGIAGTYNGYTLYAKMGNNKVYLLNMDKTIYHTWTCSPNTGYSTYLLPNKHIMRSCQYSGNILSGAAMCGMVQNVDWDGNVAWQYIYSTASYCSHHDIHVMPNGNVLLIAYEVKTAAEVTQAGSSQNIIMWPDKIVEIQPSGTNGGTVVWEWHAWDHLCQNYNSAKSNYVTSIAQHPELLNINYGTQQDWMHTNGIDYNAELDQIVISSHNLNEIYVIDHSTTTAQAAGHTGGNSGKGGDILYRWGNPQAYSCGTSSNQVFKVVHDAHWVPYGCPYSGDLVGFNNQGATGNHSCVDRITPPYNGYNYSITLGSAYLPSTYTARHVCLGDAADQSNSQQLPNGNTLVCIASTGYIYEIDANQTLLWSYTAGGTVPKAFRYTDCYLNGNITASASATPTGVCSGSSTQLAATATVTSGTTYAWTSSPSGFTSTLQNPVASPTVTTKYYVTATNSSCSSVDSVTVNVTGPISVTAGAASTTICSGRSTQLSATVSGGSIYTYSWTSSPSGFTSTSQNPIVAPTVTTTYTVSVNSGYCTAISSVTITVNSPISVSASSSPGTINLGGTSQLSSQGAGGSSYSYSWVSDPAGFTSTLQNPVVSPTVTTVYTVTATSSVCTATNTATVNQTGITPVLTVSPSTLNVTTSSGTANFIINSNTSWTASSDQSWCTVPSSGTGSGSLTANYTENTDVSSRTAHITVTTNGLSPVTVSLVQDGNSTRTLNLTLFLEGLFNGSSMNKAQGSSGAQYAGSVADQITIELHNSTSPYAVVGGPYLIGLNTNGNCTLTIPSSLNGSYYIVVKHRNSIETWTASPISFSTSTVNYNFSDVITKAFGNNLKEDAGRFLVYSGDINQDKGIDSADMTPVDNDSFNYASGYLDSDVNGDGSVDSGDMTIIDNNAAVFIGSMFPY